MLAFTDGYFVAPVRALASSCACLRRAVACASVGLLASASRTRRSSSGEWNSVHHCAGMSAAELEVLRGTGWAGRRNGGGGLRVRRVGGDSRGCRGVIVRADGASAKQAHRKCARSDRQKQ